MGPPLRRHPRGQALPDRNLGCHSSDGNHLPRTARNSVCAVIPKSPRLWISKVACAGQASRLTSNDLRSQASGLEPMPRKAGRPRYIPELQAGVLSLARLRHRLGEDFQACRLGKLSLMPIKGMQGIRSNQEGRSRLQDVQRAGGDFRSVSLR